jgi:hypothetical protein
LQGLDIVWVDALEFGSVCGDEQADVGFNPEAVDVVQDCNRFDQEIDVRLSVGIDDISDQLMRECTAMLVNRVEPIRLEALLTLGYAMGGPRDGADARVSGDLQPALTLTVSIDSFWNSAEADEYRHVWNVMSMARCAVSAKPVGKKAKGLARQREWILAATKEWERAYRNGGGRVPRPTSPWMS